jgi:uncharacterized protein YuzB (UPF0349 family)
MSPSYDRVMNSGATEGGAMARTFFCEKDGVTVRGETDDELVANVFRHVSDNHPDLVGQVPRELILGEAKDA